MNSIKSSIKTCIVIILILNITTTTFAQSKNEKADYKIYFSLRENENKNIHIVSYNGKDFENFKVKKGNSSRGENQPAISNDGKKIAFNTYQFGGWKIAAANIDGTGIKQITNSRNYSYNPSFSKNGQWIVYTEKENGRTGTRDIYKVRIDGKNKKRLTQKSKNNYLPSFSPDGSKIVFMSPREGGYKLYIMNSDGSNQARIPEKTKAYAYTSPSWSPDGKQIAFISVSQEAVLDLFIMNTDGSNIRNLTNNKDKFEITQNNVDELSYMYGTSWSPDGKTIVFALKKNGKQKLYTINTDGSNLKALVNTKGNQFNPYWVK
ncbi:DUF5050 domain-containing protein [Flavobacteriaceae bacterium AU392]|nr:DUF5050 domain-containing protein [Flavobacteriaceae bacterium]RKM85985.1 DUF5050 domain-containing protein [Flavobacteriaceae bacterium AU392]